MKVDIRELYGDWDFLEYFPKSCKEVPDCRVQKLSFFGKPDHKPHDGWEGMDLFATKTGPGCSSEELQHRRYGNVFVKENQIFYTGQAELDNLRMSDYALPFYFQTDYRSTHSLYIRDRENRECYVVYEKNPETTYQEQGEGT